MKSIQQPDTRTQVEKDLDFLADLVIDAFLDAKRQGKMPLTKKEKDNNFQTELKK